MSQQILFGNLLIVKTSDDDSQAGTLETEVSGTTDNIIVTTEDIGGDKYLKFDIGTNVFNKSTDTTDDIPSGGTINFFVTSNQNDALDGSDNPSAGNPYLTQSAADGLYLGTGTTLPISFTITGSRNSLGLLDRDMEIDGTLTNISPFIMPPVDCLLKYISASSNGVATWDVDVLQGGVSIATFSIVGMAYATSGLFNITMSSFEAIRIRQINAVGNVDSPRIILYIQQL